jgi:hypothetical protein
MFRGDRTDFCSEREDVRDTVEAAWQYDLQITEAHDGTAVDRRLLPGASKSS